jgi:hypothetical protein
MHSWALEIRWFFRSLLLLNFSGHSQQVNDASGEVMVILQMKIFIRTWNFPSREHSDLDIHSYTKIHPPPSTSKYAYYGMASGIRRKKQQTENKDISRTKAEPLTEEQHGGYLTPTEDHKSSTQNKITRRIRNPQVHHWKTQNTIWVIRPVVIPTHVVCRPTVPCSLPPWKPHHLTSGRKKKKSFCTTTV